MYCYKGEIGMKSILVVDDVATNLRMVEAVLKDSYKLTLVKSGEQALKFLSKNDVDLILMDLIMPEMDGFETYRRIRGNGKDANVPVIFFTADKAVEQEAEGLRLGAMDFIRKPIVPEVMLRRIERILELEDLHKDLEYKVEEKTKQVKQLMFETITAIAGTIDAKDPYTKGHSERVAEYSVKIAKELGMEEKRVNELSYIALLHDIGKVGIPDAILLKPDRLTDEEYATMKTHTSIGAKVLESLNSIQHIEYGALYHHERYDGRGYPNGLQGEEIPLYGRIIAAADALDAMTSNRAYRKHLPKERVLEEIANGKGTQFDPVVTDALLSLIEREEIVIE